MKKGVLIIAIGHGFYGRYAHQLAASLKFNAPGVKIAIAHDEKGISHFTDQHRSLFDKFIKIDPKLYTKGKELRPFKAKLQLHKISPFEETIFIDADVLWRPQANILDKFEELKDVDFAIKNTRHLDLSKDLPANADADFSYWLKATEVKEKYKTGKLYNIHSEFVYFKKTTEVKAMFADAVKMFDKPPIGCKVTFAGDLPDELPLALSMLKNGLNPHADNYNPIYWETAANRGESEESYDAVSFGGASLSNKMTKRHDQLAQFYANKWGFKKLQYIAKRKWQSNRTNL